MSDDKKPKPLYVEEGKTKSIAEAKDNDIKGFVKKKRTHFNKNKPERPKMIVYEVGKTKSLKDLKEKQ